MTESKRLKIINIIIFTVLLLMVGAVTFILFYRQAVASMEGSEFYCSDMKAYILEMQGLDSGYSFPYPVFFKLSAFFHLFVGAEMSVAIAVTFLNLLSMVITAAVFYYFAGGHLEAAFPRHKWLAGLSISLTVILLHFVSMVFPPEGMYLPGIRFRYLGVFTPNPFHNATYMAARPFAVLAFFYYFKLLPVYEQGFCGHWRAAGDGVGMKDYVLFSVSLLLATMTKPSFTIVLVGTAGLLMLYRMFRSGFRNFVPTVQLGLCFLPTFVDLLYQYKGVFVPQEGEEGGIGFGFAAVWRLYCDNIPLAIGLAIGFPILVTILNYKELKKAGILRFSWQIYLMSLAMALILFEKGFRIPDFNFSWGYMYGIFFLFVGALVVLLRTTAQKSRPVWMLALQWLAYGWHIACGLYYFYGIFRGNMYY